jgi:hypothetical protein
MGLSGAEYEEERQRREEERNSSSSGSKLRSRPSTIVEPKSSKKPSHVRAHP